MSENLKNILKKLKKTSNKFKPLANKNITESDLDEHIDEIREQIAFYRAYPDIFVDHMKGENSIFKFRPFQRILLRCFFRYKYVYVVFARGFSKTFTSILGSLLICVLYPNSQLFVTSESKTQAASLIQAKQTELLRLLPFLANEFKLGRGEGGKQTDDRTLLICKNGSMFDNLPAIETSRGQRRTGGSIEEIIRCDGDAIQEIIVPTMNVDRTLGDGTSDPTEILNHSTRYVTTAGWKGTYAYDMFLDTIFGSLVEPNKYMWLGGNYELSILEGAITREFVYEQKLTSSPSGFSRELESLWSGSNDNAYFSIENFNDNRTILYAEEEYSIKEGQNSYYIIGVDVGRSTGSCPTEIVVLKVLPRGDNYPAMHCVWIETIEGVHFKRQAIVVKQFCEKYNAKHVVIDANGIGSGLLDEMVIGQIDDKTGAYYQPYGVFASYGSKDLVAEYKKYITSDTKENMIVSMKAHAPENTEGYSFLASQIKANNVKFLVDESEARDRLELMGATKNMTKVQIESKLLPYVRTSFLRDQLNNLEDTSGDGNVNILIKRTNSDIQKDKVSALMYAMYHIKKLHEQNKSKSWRNGRKLSDYFIYGKGVRL